MAQRTHTPLHTGDESPSCGLCSRRARLKLTAPTATLDTPNPISSTESTKRLPIIWPLVHILPGSSFLPDQRGKPIIHLLSSTILLTPSTPYQILKLFFLHQRNIIRKDWISRTEDPPPWPGQRQRAAPPIGTLRQGSWTDLPGLGGQSPEEITSVAGLSRSLRLGEPWEQEPRSSGAVQSSAVSQSPQGNPIPSSASRTFQGPFSFLAEENELCFPEIQGGLLRASLCLFLSPPLLCFRGNAKCFCESLGPLAESADGIQHHALRSLRVARKSDLV